jgi:hypothetical protein
MLRRLALRSIASAGAVAAGVFGGMFVKVAQFSSMMSATQVPSTANHHKKEHHHAKF